MIREEYMMSMYEMKAKYPIGSIHEINGKKYKVVKHNEALPTTAFLSLPSTEFIEVSDERK
ncbi:hypothetical protein [Leuconostoc citreum]|uniref:hypothetical protein n=1 Tax=Leuconostoc citreum TaxID=33964 RepID=UPI0015F37D5A|nr:hypothetical protein [Leuconostoc citreum]MBA5937559.1 hypothetical protein [Leuconostoc citreum]